MRPLNPHEQRTVRFASIGIAIYLALFAVWQMAKYSGQKRAEYRTLLMEADLLKAQVTKYEGRVQIVSKLMQSFHLDPAKLNRATVVNEASAAIQKAALGGGIQLGPMRESAARPSSKEMVSIQLEGVGPIPAVTAFLCRLETIGFPLVIESVQLSSEANRSGPIKLTLVISIPDFELWKETEASHA
jgi:hypothetical protein